MKKVALVGMAETTRNQAPWDDDSFEIWGLNESYWGGHRDGSGQPYFKRWDRWFQMHPRWDYTKEDNFNHKKHTLWMTNAPWELDELADIELWERREETKKHNNPEYEIIHHSEMNGATKEQRRRTDFPIYMLEQADDIPGCEVYPLDDVIKLIPSAADHLRYFTQSFAYMMGLALYEGFDEIHVYGFEMASNEEYSYQKPCAEFWLGVCLGLGVKLVLPPGCKLLGAGEKLYGYDKTAGLTRMHLEIERNTYGKKLNEVREEIGKVEGEMTHLSQLLKGSLTKGKKEKLLDRMRNLERKHSELLIPFNVFNFAVKIRTNDMAKIDGLHTNDNIQMILPSRKGEDEA